MIRYESQVDAEIDYLSGLNAAAFDATVAGYRPEDAFYWEAYEAYLAEEPVVLELNPSVDGTGLHELRLPYNSLNSLKIHQTSQHDAVITHIRVSEPQRRRGIARRLQQAAMSEMRELGVGQMRSSELTLDGVQFNAGFIQAGCARFMKDGLLLPADFTIQDALDVTQRILAENRTRDFMRQLPLLDLQFDLTKMDMYDWERPIQLQDVST